MGMINPVRSVVDARHLGSLSAWSRFDDGLGGTVNFETRTVPDESAAGGHTPLASVFLLLRSHIVP